MTGQMRIVSLVPSLTEAVAALGRADQLAGVTEYCTVGAPATTATVGGTKNPDLDAVVALAPDLVLVNTEENRPPDIAALRDAGLDVYEALPKSPADVGPMLAELGARLGASDAAELMVTELDEAIVHAKAHRPRTPVLALTLIWRKPWMAVGPDTFVDGLLAECGFANALSGFDERYPKLDPALFLRPEVVLLPSEPYAFGQTDRDAVAALMPNAPHEFVDGRLLTWHGPSTAHALRTFTGLAVELDRART